MTDTPDIPELAELAAQARAAKPVELSTGRVGDDTDLLAFVLSEGQHLETLDLTEYGAAPLRARGRVGLTQADSFVEYVSRRLDTEATTLWGDRAAGTVIAVLDDHERHSPGSGKSAVLQGAPGWGEHRATLTLTKTDDWKLWLGRDGQWMTQEEFADFLEQAALAVADPDPATMLEVASSLRATKGVDFKSGINTQSGEVKFQYEETIAAKAGQKGQLEVPRSFTVSLVPFEGDGDVYPIEARFLFRIGSNGGLVLSYRLIRPGDVLRAAFDTITAQIGSQLGLPVLAGSPRP